MAYLGYFAIFSSLSGSLESSSTDDVESEITIGSREVILLGAAALYHAHRLQLHFTLRLAIRYYIYVATYIYYGLYTGQYHVMTYFPPVVSVSVFRSRIRFPIIPLTRLAHKESRMPPANHARDAECAIC